MTTINESLTAKGYTPAASVPQVFGRARTLDGIVIHHWGLPGQTHDGVVDFFVNGPGETSAHFVVSAGRINCIVSPLDAAWHSGNAVGNATTIGIECRPEATTADYATVAELVAWLRSEYGDLPLTPHRQWQSTACPGVWDLNRINALANASTITPQSTTTPVPAPTPKETEMPATKRVDSAFKARHRLPKGKAYTLSAKDDGAAANFAVNGSGHYLIHNYIRGEGLLPGQRIKAQFFISKGGKTSGHFEQDIVGTIDGTFDHPVVFNRVVEPGTTLSCLLTSSNTETAYVTGFGAEVTTWKAA